MFQQEALIDEMDKLRRFAMRLTKNIHNAEDLLQATMLRSLEKREHFQSDTNLFSWTSKIMFNLFVSDYRRKKKFETQYDPATYIDKVTVGPSQEAHVDLLAAQSNMKLLSSEHQEILLLVCVKEMTYDEASKNAENTRGNRPFTSFARA